MLTEQKSKVWLVLLCLAIAGIPLAVLIWTGTFDLYNPKHWLIIGVALAIPSVFTITVMEVSRSLKS